MPQIGELSISLKLIGLDKVKTGLEGVKDSLKGVKLSSSETGKTVDQLGKFFQANTVSFNKGEKALHEFNLGLTKFNRNASIVAKEVRNLGVAISGAFTAAFVIAAKELPEVDQAMKEFKLVTNELAKTVAVAALPAFQSFTKEVKNSVINLQEFIKEHPNVVGFTFSLGKLALVGGSVALAFIGISKAFGSVLKIIEVLTTGGTLVSIASTIGVIVASVIALSTALDSLIGKLNNPALKLLASLAGGPSRFGGQIINNLFPSKAKAGGGGDLDNTTDRVGRLVRGIKSQFQDLAENMERFGKSIAQSLENAFGDTLFDAITGRIHGLRSILKSFGEDVLRAFTRGFANSLLGGIFGTSTGGKGILGGGIGSLLGGLFGGRGRGGAGQGNANENLRGFNQQIVSTTGNLRAFQVQKDQNILTFKNLQAVMNSTIQGITSFFGGVAQVIGNLLNFIVQGFSVAIGNIVSFTQSLFSMLGGGGKKGGGILGGLLSFGGAILGNLIAPGIGGLLGGFLGGGAAALPAGAGITMGVGAALAGGGIIRKPTIALVGESGPEAVVPLDQAGGMGGHTVIVQGPSFFDNPASMDKFVRKISDAVIRASRIRTGGTSIAL